MTIPLLKNNIDALGWPFIIEQLIDKGYTKVDSILDDSQCEQLKASYSINKIYRKTVNMQQYRFGLGEYKYYNYPLPDLLQRLRESLYTQLVPVANAWMSALKQDVVYPSCHFEFRKRCEQQSQNLATPLILKYTAGGFNTLHQDLYGEVYFPIQVVFNLSQPGVDYEGGELVLTQQIPRAQSQAKVLNPKKGDMIIFSTNYRPEQGTRGYYRVIMKHGVSEVTKGNRYALGIIFHDASK